MTLMRKTSNMRISVLIGVCLIIRWLVCAEMQEFTLFLLERVLLGPNGAHFQASGAVLLNEYEIQGILAHKA
jgi:hypothetical protein